ncbi:MULTISPECIES: hypothetical protein [unclassified Coleofasciculus]|uniref:hypothetical protein n=1 Tax=unclassified Coleofasciculus TaxID=2692782 RepID=UPI00187EC6AC|nr:MULTISPECIES: hypothetical protein [unclassified Coleofasciculus]MBE9129673.1 hypothetical protein [Coleofasciculus sp. LEGE 07081]MBE9152198.1 hypothetical protein [Coleofasciculus sp. LEGE 07092]
MTYADQEFIPVDGQEEAPSYPTAFGITFTPKVSGISLAVLGLVGAVYLAINFVQPVWQEYQTLKTDLTTKESQLQSPEEIQAQIQQKKVELEQAEQQNQQVLSLFATDKALDTLLLDLNTIVQEKKEGGSDSKLISFQPAEQQEQSNIVTDSSLGAEVNGKLKRKVINVELEGSFDQIQSILRSIERLQTLLLIKDLKTEVSTPQGLLINDKGKVVPVVIKGEKAIPGAKPTLKATFNLEALSPLTEEENKATEAAAEQQAAQEPAQ